MHRPHTRIESLYFDYPLFPFRAPPEMRAARDAQAAGAPLAPGVLPLHPVAIAGGGPAGLVLALELARFGVRSVVLEADETVAEGSRAACVSRRSMQILRGIGADGAFLREALPWTHGTAYWRERPVLRLQMPHSEDERFPPMANLQQSLLEELLVERIGRTHLVELRWQSKVVGLAQHGAADGADGFVELSVDTPEGEYRMRAHRVVAADGARSTLRQLCGLALAGESFEGRFVVADIRMASPHPTERRVWFDPPSNPGGTVLMHRMARDVWRIDYQLDDDADEALESQESRVRARIAQHLAWIGETAPWQLDWVRLYRAHCLGLEDYRHGRVLFIGDAAHLVPTIGVHGMNASIADANNLGWKLAAVEGGQAPDALLDSFSLERRAATLDIFASARRGALFMAPPTRGWRLARDAALRLALDHDWARPFADPRPSTPHDYVDSPLSTPPAPDEDWARGPRAGALLPGVQLLPGRFLADALAQAAFTLFVFEPGNAGKATGEVSEPAEGSELGEVRESSGAAEAREAWRSLAACGIEARFIEREAPVAQSREPDRLPDPAGRAMAAFDARPGDALLVRPDGHLCARLRAARPDAVRAAHRRALARCPGD